MAQSVKDLPCKHEALSLIPRTYPLCACNPSAEQAVRQINP